MRRILGKAGICVLLLTISVVVSSQEETLDREFEVFYDLRGQPMVHIPTGTIQIGSTLEDALILCERLAITKEYPPCRTTAGIQTIEVSRQEPFEVTVDAFYIDQYEVSRSEYIACVDVDVCGNAPLMRQPTEPLDVPIQHATYYDAAVYCAWREARLPTEIEWEYAARGPEALTFPWGEEFDGSLTNHCDVNCLVLGDVASQSIWNDGYSELSPINALDGGRSWVGAYNMAGNVLEWTSTRSALNQSPTEDLRVIKGGSYDAYPYQTSGWFMSAFNSSQGRANIGFRCVRTTEP